MAWLAAHRANRVARRGGRAEERLLASILGELDQYNLSIDQFYTKPEDKGQLCAVLRFRSGRVAVRRLLPGSRWLGHGPLADLHVPDEGLAPLHCRVWSSGQHSVVRVEPGSGEVLLNARWLGEARRIGWRDSLRMGGTVVRFIRVAVSCSGPGASGQHERHDEDPHG